MEEEMQGQVYSMGEGLDLGVFQGPVIPFIPF